MTKKSVSCVVYYKTPYMERPQREGSAMKRKPNHKRKIRMSCQSFSLTPVDTISTQFYVEKLIFGAKKSVAENNGLQKNAWL